MPEGYFCAPDGSVRVGWKDLTGAERLFRSRAIPKDAVISVSGSLNVRGGRKLHRVHTIVSGDDECDHRITGNRKRLRLPE